MLLSSIQMVHIQYVECERQNLQHFANSCLEHFFFFSLLKVIFTGRHTGGAEVCPGGCVCVQQELAPDISLIL